MSFAEVVVISRDGERAVLVQDLETEPSEWPSSFDGSSFNGTVKLRPREAPVPIHFLVSNTFRVAWGMNGQRLRWEEPLHVALRDLALIALGLTLDEQEVPDKPLDGDYALTVQVSSHLFEIFQQEPPRDEELANYVRSRIFWTRQFKAEPTVFGHWEARRLRVEVADLEQAAFGSVGTLWERAADGSYRALPALIKQMSSGRNATAAPVQPSRASTSMRLLNTTVTSPLATYEVTGPIGEGGAGVVFGARRDDGVDVALKVLRPSAASRDKLKRFRNELHFCLRTVDPRIVRVSDFGLVATNQGDATFYVMPRFAGTLRTLMKAGVSPQAANSLTSAILDAVESAHLRGVWHRDLKPENFLTSSGGDTLVVSDFGAAHFHADLLLTAVETGPQDRLANFEYAAPEQRRKGQAVDHRCDFYSVGLIVHELFTGEVPLGKGHRLIADVAAEYGYLDEIVTWMTQQSPDSRPPNIDAVRLRLLALHKQVTARRQLDALQEKVIARVESDDPLIVSPPRLMSVDIQGRVLHLTLSTAVTSKWIQSFQNTNFQRATMGGGPSDFAFGGDHVTLTFRSFEPTAQNVQAVVDDFKRFLELGAAAYRTRVEAELRKAEEEAQRQREVQIKAEAKRLEVLKNVKI